MLTTHDREQVLELTRTLHESTPLWAQAVQALDATCLEFLANHQSPAASAILQLALLDRAAALAMGTFATTQWNFARAAGEIYGYRAIENVEGDDDGSHDRGQIPGGEA